LEIDHREIYESRSEEYERLVAAEDAAGELRAALGKLGRVPGALWLDVGTGTGRVSRLLLELGARRVVGVDRARPMLRVARRLLDARAAGSSSLLVADALDLPFEDGFADAAVAGWVFGHLRYWMPADWRERVARALDEMARAVRSGGRLLVIETLGTGAEVPSPSPELAEYHRFLEEERGFSRLVLRTDYLFASPEEAAGVTRFFFGEELASRLLAQRACRVPECTGVWFADRDTSR
jgi:ubiquinone/menaquinone biosynthesis C-methylase UbiE